MMRKNKQDREQAKKLQSDDTPELTDDELGNASGGLYPENRVPHDHIGQFQFKVEVEGVTGEDFDPDDPTLTIKKPD